MRRVRRFCGLLAMGVFLFGSCLRAEILISQEPEIMQPDAAAPEERVVEEEYYQATEVLQVEVIALQGEVGVKPREGAYGPLEEGALLESGATIKTGSGAYVELGFDESDENIVRVEEDTTAVLLLKEDEKIELLQGEVFSIIHDLPGGAAFEIRTPTAVAGARGTEWATRYKDETTDVEAYDDMPYVRSFDGADKTLGEAVDVKPGFARSVRRSQPPAEAVRISDARRRQWNRKKQDLKRRVRDVRQKRGFPKRDPKKSRQFKAKAGKGDPRVQRLKEQARRRSGDAGSKGLDSKARSPRQGSDTVKDRVEKGDSWRERIDKHLDKGGRKDLRPDDKVRSFLQPGDAGSKKRLDKEQVQEEGETGSRKKAPETKEQSRQNTTPQKIRRAAPTVSPIKR